MDFDWILIGLGVVGVVCGIVQWIRWGADMEQRMQEGDE